MHSKQKREYKEGGILEESMVLESKEDSQVERIKPSTSKREPIALHNKDSLIMTTKEEELLQEVEEEEVEVEELPIDAINAIS